MALRCGGGAQSDRIERPDRASPQATASPSLPPWVPRLRSPRRVRAALVPATPGADEGKGGALHRLPEAQLLGAICCLDAAGRVEAGQARRQRGGREVVGRGRERAGARDDQRGSGEAARHRGAEAVASGDALCRALDPIALRATTAAQSHR